MQNQINKNTYNKPRQISNESSSDTDKTSGSLFKSTTVGAGTSRVKELPASFYSRYASLDEFLSAASPEKNNISSNTGDDSIKNRKKNFKKELGERKSTLKQSNVLKGAAIPPSTQSTGKVTKIQRTKNVAKITNKSQAQNFIEEMNRDYDHNICLDRFMHDIEQNQKHETTKKEQIKGPKGDSIDRNCNISPSSTTLSSSSSNMPHSNEDTDSSRNSESIKSSNQESSKNKGNVNNANSSNSSNASSNASNSGKEDKITSNDKDIAISSSKSSESGEKSTDQSSKHMTSIESGIGSSLIIGEDETNSSQTGQSICSSSAASLLEKSKNYKGGKLGRKRKRGYIYNPQPVIEKPPKQFVPEQKKDQSYWDKRQRNNEAARRSREMRRLKEKETHDKLDRLKKENEALRVAITLLIQRNKNLEFIINELDKRETPTPITVPISC